MKKSSQKHERINWKKYSDLAVLEYLQEKLPDRPLQTRVLNILMWHGKHADICKFSYYVFHVSSMVCSGSVIILNSTNFSDKELIICVISVCITLITGINMMMKFQENWLRYRKCYEIIKSECFLYLEASGPYELLSEEGRNRLFSQFLENQALQTNTEWLSSQTDTPSTPDETPDEDSQ